MPGLAGRDCEAAGRGQPVEEKEPSHQAEMLGGKVKWFFPGLVINKRVVRMERPNVDSRCFPGWWEQEGMGFSFWGAREVGKHLLHIPAHPWMLGISDPVPAELPRLGAQGWSPYKHVIPVAF